MNEDALVEQLKQAVFQRHLKDLLFFLGGSLVSVGLWTFSPGIALIFLGIFLMAVALSLPERPRERRQ